jgi:hypothetical protein
LLKLNNTESGLQDYFALLKLDPPVSSLPLLLLFSSVASAGPQHGLPFLCVAAVPDVELLARTPRLGARLRFDLTARSETGAAGTPPPSPWVSRARRRYSQAEELPARRRLVSRARGRAPREHAAAAPGSSSPSARRPDLGARRRRRPVELPARRLGPRPRWRHLPGRVPHGTGSLNSGSSGPPPKVEDPHGTGSLAGGGSCAALRQAGPKRWS